MKQILRSGIVLLLAIALNTSLLNQVNAQSQNDLVKNVSMPVSAREFSDDSSSSDPKLIKLSYVTDYENVYTEDEAQFLKLLIMDFERKTSIQIHLVTFDFSMILKNDSSETAFSFPDNFYPEKTDKKNVIVKICIDRRMMQIDDIDKSNKLITPHQSKRIINSSFIPFFAKRKIFEGSINGLKALMKQLKMK